MPLGIRLSNCHTVFSRSGCTLQPRCLSEEFTQSMKDCYFVEYNRGKSAILSKPFASNSYRVIDRHVFPIGF